MDQSSKSQYTMDHVTDSCPPPSTPQVQLPEPVSFLDYTFEDVGYPDISAMFDWDSSQKMSGNRQVLYFGNVPYSYGKFSKHEATPYPEDPLFERIFKEIGDRDTDFTEANFTCLVTLYKDGKSYVLPHSDNEGSITPGSNIYTLSFGERRTLHFNNEKGPLTPAASSLEHGSVNIMTRASQDFWKHEIRPEKEIVGPRISLTFRHLRSPSDTPAQPPPQSTTQTVAETESVPVAVMRSLFLTDSILSATPPHLLAATNHQCLKKLNYRFEHIFNYEDEFQYSDQVIISCGVNDLHKYRHTANSLFELSGSRLSQSCKAHPNTQFIFNSVLLVKSMPWLNEEIEKFNEFMYKLCSALPNLHFFDSHATLMKARLEEVYVPKEKDSRYGNGIHITFGAKKVVVSGLARYVRSLARSRTSYPTFSDRNRGKSWAR
jgi:alkylated DNA repair dioxygenase AlkB